MKKLFILIAFVVLLGSRGSFAQSQFAIQFGADAYGASKAPNGSFTLAIGGGTRSYTTFDLKPTNVIGQFTYDARTGIEHTVYKDSHVEFSLLGQAGVASSSSAVSGIFSGGASAAFNILKLKGWRPVITAEAVVAPADASAPRFALGVGLRKDFGK